MISDEDAETILVTVVQVWSRETMRFFAKNQPKYGI